MDKSLPNLSSDEPAPLKVPRLASLLHRVLHAKDADGQPVPLLDELLFLLDDPPPEAKDRWQAGADLCAQYNIKTSRMAVWRLYRERILQWRREQQPPAPPPDPAEIARLIEQARHLAALRLLEMLGDPKLSAADLIGILRNDLRRQNLQLARDQFDQRSERDMRQRRSRLDEQLYKDALYMAKIKRHQGGTPPSKPIPPHTTS